jgi:hypothetical protein
VACYQNSQHFLSHEDAFPTPLARSNQFQRHATVLIYLNSVAQVRPENSLIKQCALCTSLLLDGAEQVRPEMCSALFY